MGPFTLKYYLRNNQLPPFLGESLWVAAIAERGRWVAYEWRWGLMQVRDARQRQKLGQRYMESIFTRSLLIALHSKLHHIADFQDLIMVDRERRKK